MKQFNIQEYLSEELSSLFNEHGFKVDRLVEYNDADYKYSGWAVTYSDRNNFKQTAIITDYNLRNDITAILKTMERNA